ncbi:uncharacterized protein LOC123037129 [Drosophila rhopaloa]|uniref:Peptidase aspartic putative domain-containing protein n=1 Tax=Drosophila rhopaloa TaxID=1041015 RepID=A0ABM5J155_DRORH|nr:uncharacterized protein LOC123037129 [Drosophila rhopaloa]
MLDLTLKEFQLASTITGNQPSLTVKPDGWKIPSNIQLADPDFYRSRRKDLLIGASMFFELLSVGQIKLAAGLSLLQKTRLGWIVTGGGSSTLKATALHGQAVHRELVTAEVHMDELVRRFWEVESCGEGVVTATKEELECEAHFKTNFRRLDSGEYSVRLPAKNTLELLGESYNQAYCRFLNLESKLERKPEVKVQYSAFIREYLHLKHMSVVPINSLSLCKYFLPHHCVFKEDSTTTKLRVVFDGSAKTSSGHSLNEVLMAGSTIQQKLFNTLLQFRTFPVALTGDICKMYRTKPAAFLSVRAMHQLANDEKSTFPIGSKIILRDFYVDDLITGGQSTQEVLEIMSQTTNLLARGGFKLRKWCSNERDVLDKVPDSENKTFLKFDDFTKTLGLALDPAADVFRFSFSPIQVSPKPCKRLVLSTIARVYDPLGLIGPVVAKAKIFLQQVWREKLEWDESFPEALNTSWLKLSSDMGHTQQMKFPRRALHPNGAIEINGFCDASIDAYGGCIYLVSIADGKRECIYFAQNLVWHL